MEKYPIYGRIRRWTKLCVCNWCLWTKWNSTNCRRFPTKQSKPMSTASLIFFDEFFFSSVCNKMHFPFQNKPNVDSRVDPSDPAANAINAPLPGYFGVQTSSFSSSSDVNGVKKHKEAAVTTINDNGKVSSYTVEN